MLLPARGANVPDYVQEPPLPPLYCTEFSVQKIPTRVQ